MKKNLSLVCASLFVFLFSAQVWADVAVPSFKEGDKWTFNITEAHNVNGAMNASTRKWENVISRSGSHNFSLTSKTVDSNLPPKEFGRNTDWSIVSSINGENTITSRPYDFPLVENKTWKVEYQTNNPSAKVKLEKISKQYTVLGWEEITVPAGTFRAMKIEMEGEWHSEFNPVGASALSAVSADSSGSTGVVKAQNASTPKPASGKLYQAFWYVPEVKNYVKAVYEDYQSGGALNKRTTEELESFTSASHQ